MNTFTASQNTLDFNHVEWSRNATIYEVNVRQFSPEGSFAAVETQLPRLRNMGVDIVWLMPIHPIGLKERKGTLGSYYSVSDYRGINPEFGTLADFKSLVNATHAHGMKLIIDWVPNHTAWDHAWATSHPDFYKKNEKGEIYAVTFETGAEPEYWTDVIGLDYSHRALWDAMRDEMAYWVRETDIDGFRCDVAGLVPTPFWEFLRVELDRIKPMFMLAEWSAPDLHASAFDMTYDLEFYDVLKKIGKGHANAKDLNAYLAQQAKDYPAHAYRMKYTANHDSNSWIGSDAELFGSALKAMAVLAATLPGMALVYNGQESGLDKRIQFFEKDAIDWKQFALESFYRDLLTLKRTQPALANGQYGGSLTLLDTANDAVFAFRREREGRAVTVVVNLTAQPQSFNAVAGCADATIESWGYRIALR